MLEVIEKLLILQDRDRKIARARAELNEVGPQRENLNQKLVATQAGLKVAQENLMTTESRRKDLDLEVLAKKEQLQKYSIQQMQTKKNEEFQAFGREIDNCKNTITEIEDRELEVMMEIDLLKASVKAAAAEAETWKKDAEKELSELKNREEYLTNTLTELESSRDELTAPIDETEVKRYDRILRQKGTNVVVGIDRRVCGGCHMGLPTSTLLTCQKQQEIITCTNCGRILYFTRDMIVTEGN